MKNDSTTTFLNFVLAALLILAVLFAMLGIWRTRDLRQLTPRVQIQAQQFQIVASRAQALLQDTITYNATARSPELQQIINSAQTPATAQK
jgi:hypothetical protein